MEKESKRTLKIFAWASFFNDMGSDMIYPVWPLFVTEVLKANMSVLGFVDGLGEAVVSISKALSGFISDRVRKRKVFIWTGYVCGTISKVGYAFSTVWMHLVPFRVLDRAGKIRSSPRDAVVADMSTRQDRGRNFGMLKAMDNLGAVCGILLCIVLFNIVGYRKLFMIAAVPAAISAILILFFIKEKKPAENKIYEGLSVKNLSGNAKLFFILSAVFALGNFTYSFLLVSAKLFGFKDVFIPILYLLFAGSASIFSLPFGRLADKVGRKPLMSLSFVLWGLTVFSFIMISGRWTIILAFILYGAHKGALEPVQKTFVSELSPVEYRASSLGLYQMVIGLCALPASFIAGVLWDNMGVLAPFYFSIGLTAVSVVMLTFVKEPKV